MLDKLPHIIWDELRQFFTLKEFVLFCSLDKAVNNIISSLFIWKGNKRNFIRHTAFFDNHGVKYVDIKFPAEVETSVFGLDQYTRVHVHKGGLFVVEVRNNIPSV